LPEVVTNTVFATRTVCIGTTMDRLTEMEAFATGVDQGGFTDAARKMGISKSAVSRQVSALEARLCARLLTRTTRRVSPAGIGLCHYDRARHALNDAGEADALETPIQSPPLGPAADFGVNLLSPILADFLLEYPDITVNMVPNSRYVELISIPGLPVGILGICAVCLPGRFTQPKVRPFIDFLARRYMDKGPDIRCAQRNDRTLFIPPRSVLTGSRSKWPRPACFWRARLRSCWWPEGQDNPPRLP
jgi:DNA-binding transcriptional LysR family regulator